MKVLTNKQFISTSLKQTEFLAYHLAKLLGGGDVITLEGDLGTGKTAFTKGLAKALGIEEPVTSPTFTIIKEYEASIPLYHIDAYRLEFSDEDIGLDEYINENGITVIEWAQFIEQYLPEELLNIKIDYIDETSRSFTFTAKGKYYEDIITRLFKEVNMT